MKRILSFGAGVDSSTLLALYLDGINSKQIPQAIGHIDRVIFADTGAESDATYSNVDQFKTLCIQADIPFDIVKRSGENIFEWVTRNGCLPVMPKARHVCSLKFKAEVIQKRIKELYGDEPITYLIGIEANEKRRAGKFTKPRADSAQYVYPLIDMDWDRSKCESYLQSCSYLTQPVVKSSCVFCPFMSHEEILEIRNDPAAWAKVKLVESRFKQTSPLKHQAWLDAGKPLNKGGRCNKGHWKLDSWKEGARLFIRPFKGKVLSVSEWEVLEAK